MLTRSALSSARGKTLLSVSSSTLRGSSASSSSSALRGSRSSLTDLLEPLDALVAVAPSAAMASSKVRINMHTLLTVLT